MAGATARMPAARDATVGVSSVATSHRKAAGTRLTAMVGCLLGASVLSCALLIWVSRGIGSNKPDMSAVFLLRQPAMSFPPPPRPWQEKAAPRWPLFWVMTLPANEQTRCQEILLSWGLNVPPTSLVFVGAEKNMTLPSGHRFVALPVSAERKALKEMLAWQYVVQEYPDRDWYVKGDDDTYFVVGSLNRYVEEMEPSLPYFLGCKFHYGGVGGVQYVSGGPGYILSRTSASWLLAGLPRCLKLFAEMREGDLAVSQCLQTAGVFPEDTRDAEGRQRFHVFPYDYHLGWYRMGLDTKRWWYHDYLWGSNFEGTACCSDTTVSFHYMAGKMLKLKFP
eukprot:TRINITY_DN65372_c0_g1_i1.p1 TRINITY_DN65372_c0_g1~~TRINITY_DN65372_c0_g1_i1.p1  ORF type:complete len:336 (-),score=60.22 TRINITY_DN65372_c0_g1_i1:30-1037(-)